MSDVAVTDVEHMDSMGWDNLESDTKEALLEQAQSEAESIYSGRTSTLPVLDGPKDQFIKLLAAHKYELAEGGEAQSESQTGGSTTYNTVTGDALDSLTQTRYGREALGYIRERQGISVVRRH